MELEQSYLTSISKKKIYSLLRHDSRKYIDEARRNGYNIGNFEKQELWSLGGSDDLKFICMEAARGDLELYDKYYYRERFKDIYELYTLRLVVNYTEPLRK